MIRGTEFSGNAAEGKLAVFGCSVKIIREPSFIYRRSIPLAKGVVACPPPILCVSSDKHRRRMETEVKEKEKAKRGKELKEFCPPNRRPLPLLLSLSFFYAWRQGNKQTIFSPETCSHCRDSCHECPALPIRQIIMRKIFF